MNAIAKQTIIVRSLILNKYKQILHSNVDYWQNHNDPESLYHLGTSKNRQIERAKEDLNDANKYGITLSDVKKSGYLRICLRAAMRDTYITAIDFCENPFIKISNLKRVILLRKIYDKVAPEHKQFSVRYLTNLLKY